MMSCFARIASAFCKAISTTKSVSVFSEYAAARSSRRLACGLSRRLMRSGRWAVRDITVILKFFICTSKRRTDQDHSGGSGFLGNLLRHQPPASERFLHARAAGLVVLGILVDVPDVVDALARQ